MHALAFWDKYFLYHRQIGNKPYIHVLICKPNIGCVDIFYVYMHKTGNRHKLFV